MITFLNFFALIFWFFGIIAFVMGKGVPHETEGLIMILTGFVTCCGAAILDRIDKFKAAIEKTKQEQPATPA